MGFNSWKRTQKSRWLLFPRHRLWPYLAGSLRSMVASHSVKLYGCFRCRGPRFPKKAYTYKSPSRHVLKLAMTTAYFLKKAYNEKALSSLVFSNGSGAAHDAPKTSRRTCSAHAEHISSAQLSLLQGDAFMPTIRHDKRIQAVLPLYFCIIPYHCGIVNRNKNICLHYFASVFFCCSFRGVCLATVLNNFYAHQSNQESV